MTPKLYLSVVIPCYNEEKNILHGALDQVYTYLQSQTYLWELIIVNDGSTDNSRNLILDFIKGKKNVYFYDIPHGGKPDAVWAGLKKAKGEIILFTDTDQSTPITELAKLLPWYTRGFDIVIGSRGDKRQGFSVLRKLGSSVFRWLRALFLTSLSDIKDTQCGFKSCKRVAALRVFPKLQFFKTRVCSRGWRVSAYDVELLHLMKKAGYKIKEVEVFWKNQDISDTKQQGGGEFRRYLKESKDMAKEVIRVKVNDLKGLYHEI